MDRMTPPPLRAVPGCADCRRLQSEEATAERDRDLSRAIDCRVLFSRHHDAAHRGEQ